METLSIVLTVAIFVWYLVYDKYENKKDKMMLIRELTTSLKAKDVEEYKDNVPEYKEVIIPAKPQDELVQLEEIDPEHLLGVIRWAK